MLREQLLVSTGTLCLFIFEKRQRRRRSRRAPTLEPRRRRRLKEGYAVRNFAPRRHCASGASPFAPGGATTGGAAPGATSSTSGIPSESCAGGGTRASSPTSLVPSSGFPFGES